jgi:iron(III) transport system ATP-binding protein
LTTIAEADTPAPVREAHGAPVAVRGLEKRFGAVTVLEGVDLDVPAGSILALLGPSGCGKTTLLRCLAGLEEPDAGEIRIGPRAVTGPGVFVRPERRRVGMVFQEPALFPHMTVARNVGYGLRRHDRRGGRVDHALDMVGLAGLADRLPGTLSGGQQQRVSLARALAAGPDVILLDEPFSALDAPLRAGLRRDVRALLAEAGVTAVFVTHDQEEAFTVGDRVAVMLEGRLEQVGTPAELYEAPASRAVAEFVGDANLIPAHAAGGLAHSPIGAIPLACPLQGPVDVVIRPECITACPGGDALVEHVEYYGHDTVLVVRACDGCPVRARVMGTQGFAPGDRVGLDYTGRPSIAFVRDGDREAAAPA